MPDEFDRASELETRQREDALARVRSRVGLLPCGACHNCGEELPPGRLFCDADCRDDFEKRHRQK